MGIGPRWSDGGGEPLPGNPNPMRFSILSTVQIGDLHLSVLQYEGCTNFEGRKVLLTTWNPRGRSSIDPHFAEGSGIIARFEPSAAGLSAGRVLAEALASGGDVA